MRQEQLVGQIYRFALAFALGIFAVLSTTIFLPSVATAQDRSLYLYYTHTQETARITFRKNGRYDQAGLRELNQFLRDWRRGEPTQMDPALFDLIWQVYQDVGGTQPIHVVSAYRAPETNEMLRSRSNAVAKNSRHTMGMAMDFFIPGVSLAKLREAAMKRQVGGVGYYPTSGSPFVHLDTGNVRAWPRMTKSQLQRLFPDGRTLHLASDGSVLSQEGRQYASNQWQKCHSVPCIGNNANTMPNGRGGGGSNGDGNGRTLIDFLFGNDGAGDNAATSNNNAGGSNPGGPNQRVVTAVAVPSAPILPPDPSPRSILLDLREPAEPPLPVEMPEAILVAMRTTDEILPEAPPLASNVDQITTASLLPAGSQPLPRVLLSDDTPVAGLLSAYAPQNAPEPDAQRALQMLIERRNGTLPETSVTPDPAAALRGGVVTASLSGDPISASLLAQPDLPQSELPQIQGAQDLFASTFAAVEQQNDGASASRMQVQTLDYKILPVDTRDVLFYAPDIDQVSESPLVAPESISGAQFAVLFEPDEGDFSPRTELGKHCASMQFGLAPAGLSTHQFSTVSPKFTASL